MLTFHNCCVNYTSETHANNKPINQRDREPTSSCELGWCIGNQTLRWEVAGLGAFQGGTPTAAGLDLSHFSSAYEFLRLKILFFKTETSRPSHVSHVLACFLSLAFQCHLTNQKFTNLLKFSKNDVKWPWSGHRTQFPFPSFQVLLWIMLLLSRWILSYDLMKVQKVLTRRTK